MKRLLSVALLVLLVSLPAQADRVFTSGAEENNFLETMWSSLFNTPTIVTTPVHSGTYSFHLIVDAGVTGFRRLLVPDKASGTLYTRWYIRIAAHQTGATARILRWQTSGGGTFNGIRVVISGGNHFLNIKNNVTATEITGTFDLALDTWYRLEFRCLISATVGELELQLFIGDSTTLTESISITGEDTQGQNYGQVIFRGSEDATFDLYMDDIAINDEVGSVQNSFPGPGKIFLVKPSSDDTVTWDPTPSTPTTNFDKIDDVPGAPDDITTYTSTTTADEVDKLNIENLGAEVTSDADMILAVVAARQGSDGTAGQRRIKYRIWDEADASTDGPVVSADINGWRIADTDEFLVFDMGTRSKADFDSFKAGYFEQDSNTRLKRVTALWVNVEWIEAAAVTVRPARREIKID